MDRLLEDLRNAARALRHSAGFTLTAVATIALGIAACTAMFAVVEGVLLRPLPYPDASRLLRVWSAHAPRGIPQFSVSAPDALDWAARARSLEAVGAFERARPMAWTGGDQPEQLLVSPASPGAFAALGVPARLGHALSADDGPRALVISDALWRRRFGSDPAMVGRAVTLDGATFTVSGVMPRGFVLPGSPAEAWTSLDLRASDDRSRRFLRVLARVRPGTTVEGARAELETIAAQLEAAHPATNAGWSVSVRTLHESIVGPEVGRALVILLAVVGLVLLIACANVANLLLVRGMAREREMAIRAALGAGRLRLVAQLLAESTMIAVAGGTTGLVLAGALIAGLRAAAPDALPRLEEIAVNGRIVAFAAAVSLAAAALLGLVPAVQGSRVEAMSRALREGRGVVGVRATHVRGALVALEVALAVVVTTGSLLLVRSLWHLQAVDPGFDASRVVAAPLAAREGAYASRTSVAAFYASVLDRVRALPGVERASLVSSAPFFGPNSANLVAPEGQSLERANAPDADFRVVAPGYFATLRIPLRRGRDFDAGDAGAAASVAIVNETLARRLWPGQDAIGHRFRLGDIEGGPWLAVVGVAADALYGNLEAVAARPMAYLPHAAAADRTMTLVVRTAGGSTAAADALREAVWSVDRGVPVPLVRSLDEVVAVALAGRRFNASLFALFAAMALALSAVGVYGVMAHFVTLRRPEIGIRVALGASPRAVAIFVLRRGGAAVGAGLVAGLGGALVLAPLLRNLLYGVDPGDPGTVAAVAGLFGALTALAAWSPARRAIRLDPVQVLREG